MNGEKYQVGDTLICIPGLTTRDNGGDGADCGGSGYEEGKIITVLKISDADPNDRKIYWFKDSGKGIYGRALKLYQPDLVVNNYQIF